MNVTHLTQIKLTDWFQNAAALGTNCDLSYSFAFIEQLMIDHGFRYPSTSIKTFVEQHMLDSGVGHMARMHIRMSLHAIIDIYETNQLFEEQYSPNVLSSFQSHLCRTTVPTNTLSLTG